MAVNAKALAKAIALIAWADGKLEVEELKTAREVFGKYGIDWIQAKPLLEAEMETFIEGDGGEEERDSDINIGVLDFGEVDFKAILDDLAAIAAADKKIDHSEVQLLHLIGRAANLDPVMVTASLLEAANKSGASLNF